MRLGMSQDSALCDCLRRTCEIETAAVKTFSSYILAIPSCSCGTSGARLVLTRVSVRGLVSTLTVTDAPFIFAKTLQLPVKTPQSMHEHRLASDWPFSLFLLPYSDPDYLETKLEHSESLTYTSKRCLQRLLLVTVYWAFCKSLHKTDISPASPE